MSQSPSPLIESRRAEAVELLRLNQRLRMSATWTMIAALVIAATGTIAAVLARDLAVLLPLPTVTTLLCALGFQQFADVSVVGAARRDLEQLLDSELGGLALLYESAVAGIRQRAPLVVSVRLLQAAWATSLLALLIAASDAAYSSGYEIWVVVAYSVLTAVALLAAGASYRDMLRSGRRAGRVIAAETTR